MVDEKGRLFGKINLLDLVIVLVILGVAGRFGYKAVTGKKAAAVGEDKTVEVTFRLSGVMQPTVAALPVGTEVFDSKSNADLGKIVAVQTAPAIVVGNSQEFESKYRVDYLITVSGAGRVTPNNISLAGLEMKIGRPNDLKTAEWAGTGTIWTINTNPGQH